MKSLNYLINHTLFQILKTILSVLIIYHGTPTNKFPVQMYVNKMGNKIILKIKSGYYFQPSTTKNLKLRGRTDRRVTRDKKGKNVPLLEIKETILGQCHLVNNRYQQNSKTLFTFVPDKPFRQLLSRLKFIFFIKFHSYFSYIKVWFTDQSFDPLDIECRINLTLVIN